MGRKITSQTGVRVREHKTRKYRGKPDKYFMIRYYDSVHKEYREDGAGWSSQQMTAIKAAGLRAEILGDIKAGKRPQSLKEKREWNLNAKMPTRQLRKKKKS